MSTPPRNGDFGLRFDNSFLRDLPADLDMVNRRRQVYGAGFSLVAPTPVARPQLLAYAREVGELIGLQPEAAASPRFADVFGGNELLDGMTPSAMCYGGHQFGGWAGQLGDGRAISLGEVLGAEDRRWELQLKGAGPTPYSRSADGRAVLRSSVREFLCSEAMHHLGVPTTRALSLVATGDTVVRDMFYDGHPRPEPGAVVCRVAPSFIRFGNFEIFAARGDLDTLRALTAHTLARHYPELGPLSPGVVPALVREVGRRTALMVAHWMRVGFVHGVMNTDNMSVLGLTIDYGPYGWLDDFDEGWTPNTTDAGQRRYRYGHQPTIAHWNLARFAQALVPLVEALEPLEEVLSEFPEEYLRAQRPLTAAKLGLRAYRPVEDDALVGELLDVLQSCETDMAIFFRRLAEVSVAPEHAERARPLADAFYRPETRTEVIQRRLDRWLEAWAARARDDGSTDDERQARMRAANPKYVLRNYLAQVAIDAAEAGDPSRIVELLEVLRRPYDEQPEHEGLAAKRPDWARDRPGCSTLSCSS